MRIIPALALLSIAPITSFLADEVWQARHPDKPPIVLHGANGVQYKDFAIFDHGGAAEFNPGKPVSKRDRDAAIALAQIYHIEGVK